MNPDGDDDAIEREIEQLNSLREGERTVARLVACGARAIEPLRRFLLEGKPSHIFQPRQWAVEALARLGAREVLIEYLARDQEITDPEARFGEDAVVGTAARLIAAWRDAETAQFLLGLLRRKPLPGLLTALGELRLTEAIPELIVALGDDLARPFAEEALAKIGEAAHPALVAAALTRQPSVDEETPSSLLRRRSVLRLLIALKLATADWQALSCLADDAAQEIAAHAQRIALAAAAEGGKEYAVRRLLRMLADPPSWALQIEIERWLGERAALALAAIEEEIACLRGATDDGPLDKWGQRLLALKRRIEKSRGVHE